MANSIHLAVCVLFSVLLCFEISHGYPLDPEDVASLLPETPKTKNETVEAIVKDAVVQEAVQTLVGDGTLSGLVVKKNIVILPAAEPDVVITQKEQILEAPLTHLEDIRKNITETAATMSEKENSEVSQVDEISVAEVIPVNDKTSDPVSDVLITEKIHENPLETLIAEDLVLEKKESTTNLPEISVGDKLVVPGIADSEIKLPEGIIPDKISLPAAIQEKISKPVFAVLNPNNVVLAQSNNPVNALPISTESTSEKLANEDENSLEKSGLEFGARIPVAIITSEESDLHPAVKLEVRSIPEEKTVKNVIAVFTVAEEDGSEYLNDDNDMVAAEDIIFRPLFRYRQQQNERSRFLENRAYQRTNYNRYRPSYSSSYDDYNSGKNSYRKSQRTRYRNDYY